MNGVRAKCRVCGEEALADQFKLHHDFRQMVCPSCFTGKTEQKKAKKEAVPPKPAGWDAEDDYLEKAARMRNREDVRGTFKKIPGTPQVQYTCLCSYTFKYDPFRKIPTTCPYCNQEIPRLKTFSLL